MKFYLVYMHTVAFFCLLMLVSFACVVLSGTKLDHATTAGTKENRHRVSNPSHRWRDHVRPDPCKGCVHLRVGCPGTALMTATQYPSLLEILKTAVGLTVTCLHRHVVGALIVACKTG